MENEHLLRIIELALAEDVGPGDLTTSLTIAVGTKAEGRITAKQDLILSGLVPARLTFRRVDPDVKFTAHFVDGDRVSKGDVVATASGPASSILIAERPALNFMMRLSGISTFTDRFVQAVSGRRAKIIDTRKTTPGLRVLEKAAVRHGGGGNHRVGLYDGILIKDNHIAAAGSITAAVTRAKSGAPHTIKVEVEVEDVAGLEEAIKAQADAALLDNMTPAEMAEAVRFADGRILLEASGGVNLDTVSAVADSGVDLISIGALTHSAPAVDLSMRF